MSKGLVLVVALGLGVAAVAHSIPAAAELVPGGWAEPIPIPPPPTEAPSEPAAQRPLPQRIVRPPVRPRAQRPTAPARAAPLPDGRVQF